MSAKDQAIFEQTKDLDFIRYALSYVRDAAEMAKYRENFGASAYLIAKLERKPAMEAALEIAEIANELWICRGDLGAELGEQAMAEGCVSIYTAGTEGIHPGDHGRAGVRAYDRSQHANPVRSMLPI